jgi:hypothetical protein
MTLARRSAIPSGFFVPAESFAFLPLVGSRGLNLDRIRVGSGLAKIVIAKSLSTDHDN